MTIPFSPEEVERYRWVKLPELPEGFVWDTRVNGDGMRFIDIRDAELWWIEAGERIVDETIEVAAERCKAKFDEFQKRGPTSRGLRNPPVFANRFGVQPQWVFP